MMYRWLVLIALMMALSACTSDSAERENVSSQAVSLQQGAVSGVASPYDAGISVFRGLPYAAAPVGDLRWQPPQSAPSWEGVRVADTFAESCHQPRHASNFVWRRADFPVSEDCLYLNVWARNKAENLPIMVWFHGGAHISGQSHSLLFDGTSLAQQGVMVVTINYRLGPLGFLAHPLLSESSARGTSGNYGLMDKLKALAWIQENAKALGGDPGNVTVFGQSAGSQSVCSLLSSAHSEGLFHKAIGQSAGCVTPLSVADANGYARGELLVQALGATSAADLYNTAPDALLEAMVVSGWESDSRIVIDGDVLKQWPHQTYASADQLPVPLMLGFLANEGEQLFPVNHSLTDSDLMGFLTLVAGDSAQELKALYASPGLTPGEIQHAISTDVFMAFGMQRWAEYHAEAGHNVYLYFMDHVPPAFHIYMPDQPYLELPDGPRSAGAYHSGDLAYVFGNTDKVGSDWSDDDHALSKMLVRHWTNFAKTGDPNAPGELIWPAFNRHSLTTRVLNPTPRTVSGVKKRALEIFASRQPFLSAQE